MSNKNKNHKMAIIIAISFTIAVMTKSSGEETTVNHEWTRDEVRSLLAISGHYLYPGDKNYEEQNRFRKSVDQVYPYLIEALDEEHRNSYIVPNIFLMFANTKNNHELFVSVISNKLAKTTRDSQIAAMALERIGGENATTVLIGILDDEKEVSRRFAVRALVTIGTDSAYEAISEFVSRQRDEETAKRDSTALREARAALEQRDARKENTTTTTNAVPEKATTP